MEEFPWAKAEDDEPTNQKPDKTAQVVQKAMRQIGFDDKTCTCPFGSLWSAQKGWRSMNSFVPDWIKNVSICNCKGKVRGFITLQALYQHSISTDRRGDDLLCHQGFAMWLRDSYPVALQHLPKPRM